MHKPESVQENETHNILDFEVQTNHLIPARTFQVLTRKKEFAILWILSSQPTTLKRNTRK